MKRTQPRRGSRMWSNLPLRAKGFIVILIPLVSVAFAGMSSIVVSHQENNAQELMERTIALKSRVQTVLQLTVDAETGVRGYLLTGERRFLERKRICRKRRANCARKLMKHCRSSRSEPTTSQSSHSSGWTRCPR